MKGLFTPVVSGLIVACTALLVVQYVLALLPGFGALDRRITLQLAMHGNAFWHGDYYRPLTSLFLHDGWMHLGINMLALLSFGGAVEKTYGHLGFAVIYLIGGVFASLLFGLFSPNALCIGASGAVSAILMLSAMKYPAQIIILAFIPMPIRLFVVVYVLAEAYYAFGASSSGAIAHTAHLGGLAFGFAYFKLFDGKPKKRLPG